MFGHCLPTSNSSKHSTEHKINSQETGIRKCFIFCGDKCVPQVSHVFVSLLELGLAALTNKAGAGMVAFGHIVPGLDPVSQLIQASEQIMINLL